MIYMSGVVLSFSSGQVLNQAHNHAGQRAPGFLKSLSCRYSHKFWILKNLQVATIIINPGTSLL